MKPRGPVVLPLILILLAAGAWLYRSPSA